MAKIEVIDSNSYVPPLIRLIRSQIMSYGGDTPSSISRHACDLDGHTGADR